MLSYPAREAPPLTLGVLRTHSIQMGPATFVTWVPQNRQAPPLTPGVLHTLSVRSKGKHFTKLGARLTGPSALQGLLILLTQGANNSRPDYTAPKKTTKDHLIDVTPKDHLLSSLP